MRGKQSHLPGLDGLRGLAALGVVILHVWMYTGANRPDVSTLLDTVIGEFRIGVVAFFVLSAFLLVKPWIAAAGGERDRPPVAHFLFRRAARILPAYWAAMFAAFFVLQGTGSGRAAPAGDLPIFAALGQFQVDATRKLLIPQAWSLAVELSFYLLLPLAGWAIVRLARSRGPRFATLALSAFLGAAGIAWCTLAELVDLPLTTTVSLPTYLPVFACGMAASALPVPRGLAGRRAMLVGGAAIVFLNSLWHSQGTGFVGHVLLDMPAAAGFGIAVAALAAGPAGLLERQPIRWLGTVSYGLYLWHLPVLYGLRAHELLPYRSTLESMGVVLGLSLVLAAISWYALERPIMRLTQRRRTARTSVATRSPARTAPSMYPAQ